jgi:hypothetical protein
MTLNELIAEDRKIPHDGFLYTELKKMPEIDIRTFLLERGQLQYHDAPLISCVNTVYLIIKWGRDAAE